MHRNGHITNPGAVEDPVAADAGAFGAAFPREAAGSARPRLEVWYVIMV